MSTAIENIMATLATLRSTIEKAKAAHDVVSDPVALEALTELEIRISVIESAAQGRDYEAVRQAVHEVYVAAGQIQVVAATAATRRGGYKGAAATNAARAISSDTRLSIKADFERLRAAGEPKERAYGMLARRYKLNDRSIRRAVKS